MIESIFVFDFILPNLHIFRGITDGCARALSVEECSKAHLSVWRNVRSQKEKMQHNIKYKPSTDKAMQTNGKLSFKNFMWVLIKRYY